MSPTTLEPPAGHGEQPTVITEKARFSWPILVAFVGIALTAAGGLQQASAADACCKTATTDLHRHELRIQRVEDAQSASADALRDIRTELRRMNEQLERERQRAGR